MILAKLKDSDDGFTSATVVQEEDGDDDEEEAPIEGGDTAQA